jgi:predicted transcriptional regulator
MADIEDRLFPILDLDVWERCLYYHLLRHTRVLGVGSVSLGLVPIARANGMSEDKVRGALRSMNKKGCIQIEDRNRKGHVVRVLLPTEIERLSNEMAVAPPVDLEKIDFFADRRYLAAILRRDGDEVSVRQPPPCPTPCDAGMVPAEDGWDAGDRVRRRRSGEPVWRHGTRAA